MNYAFDFFQLFHQMQLGRQASGGVDQDHVFTARLAGTDRVKAHRGGVAAVLADDLDRVAIGPDTQLLARCRTKGIGRRQQHASAADRQVFGQFANGCGFACAIHARHHDDGGLVLADDQSLFQWFEHLGQLGNQHVLQCHRVGDAAVFDGAAQLGHQELRGGHARVGHQQRVFEFFVQRLVNLRTAKGAGNAGRCLSQARFELVHPLLPFWRCRCGQRYLYRGDQRRTNQRAAGRKGRSGGRYGCCSNRTVRRGRY